MNVAVLGSGAGGCALAFDFARFGHRVSLFDFPEFSSNIEAVQQNGGLYASGGMEGFAAISSSGHDIGKALEGAELIFVVGPAYSTTQFALAAKPYLKPGQVVVVCPGSCGGALEFIHSAGLKLGDDSIIVSETSTLPYAVRVTEPGRLKIFLRLTGGVFLSAIPAKKTNTVMGLLNEIFPYLVPATNAMQTSLQNGNPVIHPAVTLLNATAVERTQGDFLFYEEGVTPAVGRLMESIDRERIKIGQALGVSVMPDPELGCLQGYMTEATYDIGFSTAPGFKGIKAQSSLDHRYIQEDVGYGLVFMKSLADQLGVSVPNITSLIQVISTIMGIDYLKKAPRTLQRYGLGELTAEELTAALA